MDWTKAKTILIIAFVVTNLFLGGSLLRDHFRQEVTAVSDQYLTQTEAFLDTHGVVLDTELPVDRPSLGSLTVEYRFFPPRAAAQQLLGDQVRMTAVDTYENRQGKVAVKNNKELTLRLNEPVNPLSDTEELPDLEEETLEKSSRQFLESADLAPETLSLQQIYVGMMPRYDRQPLHKLVFEQTYQDRFVGESYVHVYMNQQGIVAVEALLLEEIQAADQSGTKRPMIPAPEAVLRKLDTILSEQEGKSPIVIRSIEPGHYFSLTQEPLTQWEAVASGTAVPAWKIVLKNGDTYYQEAF